MYITTANLSVLATIRADPGVLFVEASHVGVDTHVRDFRANRTVDRYRRSSKRSKHVKRQKTWNTKVQERASWNLRVMGHGGRLTPPVEQFEGSYEYVERAGLGVKVYVMDGGIQLNLSAFGGRAFNFPKRLKMDQESPYVPEGNLSKKEGMNDADGHGTFVAGIVGGNYTGVAPHVTIFSVKVYLGNREFKSRGRIQALNDIAEAHEEDSRDQEDGFNYRGSIVNMSWDTKGHYESLILGRALTKVANKGIYLVAAAGNSNRVSKKYPCVHENVSCVGSMDENYWKSAGSNFGPHVHWQAPGEFVMSLVTDGEADRPLRGYLVDPLMPGYGVASGTSFAAPHLVRAVAIWFSWRGFMTEWKLRPILLANSVKDAIKHIPGNMGNWLVNTGISNSAKDDREPFVYAGSDPATQRTLHRFVPHTVSTIPHQPPSGGAMQAMATGGEPVFSNLPPPPPPPEAMTTFRPSGGSTVVIPNVFITNTSALSTIDLSVSYWTRSAETTSTETKSTETTSTETGGPDCDSEETAL